MPLKTFSISQVQGARTKQNERMLILNLQFLTLHCSAIRSTLALHLLKSSQNLRTKIVCQVLKHRIHNSLCFCHDPLSYYYYRRMKTNISKCVSGYDTNGK